MFAPLSSDDPAVCPAEGPATPIEVRRRSLPGLTVAVCVHRGASSDIPGALQRWHAQVSASGLQVCGAPLAIFSSGDRDLDAVPVRLCVPVSGDIPAELGIRSARLDPVDVIEAQYCGAYSGIGAAYDALCLWLEGCELCIAQGVSETVRDGPPDGRADGPWTIDVAMRLCGPTGHLA